MDKNTDSGIIAACQGKRQRLICQYDAPNSHSIGGCAERDGYWSAISLAEDDKAAVQPIVQRHDDEPLVLIEDEVAKTDNFEEQGNLYDAGGKLVKALPKAADAPARLKDISEFVRSKRSP